MIKYLYDNDYGREVTLDDAISAYPSYSDFRRVEGGFACFEFHADFELWEKAC